MPHGRKIYLLNSKIGRLEHVKMSESGARSGETDALVAAVEIACRGLVYPSERDYPIEPFFLENTADLTARELVDQIKGRFTGKFVEADFDQFFERLIKDQPWHTSLKKREVKKFRSLRNLLKTRLKNIRVYRFGEVQIDILVFGEDGRGNLAGIKTRAIET